MKKYAVILVGGKGTRLWPLSRQNYPKQFVEFRDGLSLFQLTIKRILSFFKAEEVFFVSQNNYEFNVINQIDLIPDLSKNDKALLKRNLILEPTAKNTLPAIILSLKYLEFKNKLKAEDLLYIFPSDHIIEPLFEFKKCLNRAAPIASMGTIVVFGVVPVYPKEGYGYVLTGRKFRNGFLVRKFVEKPTVRNARSLLKKGAYWNAGIFCFNKEVFLSQLKKYQPKIYSYYKLHYEKFISKFKEMETNSIDYAILQKTSSAGLVRLTTKWSDLGNWDSFLEFYGKDKGNFSIGKAHFLDSKNCFSYSNKRLVSFVGLKDIVAVDSQDALLLIKKGLSDRVKGLVNSIGKNDSLYTQDGLTVYRPWGYYTVLHEEKGYKVKEIGIYPKRAISLQRHSLRSEHWNVVEGQVDIMISGRKMTVKKNQSIYVPRNTKHKVYNPTNKIVKIIEVQIGSYLGEDDIKRFDKYKSAIAGS